VVRGDYWEQASWHDGSLESVSWRGDIACMGKRKARATQRSGGALPQARGTPLESSVRPASNARSSRPAGAAHNEVRNRRLVRLALGVTLLAAALAPLIAISVRGDGSRGGAPARPPNGVVDRKVAELLGGIPQQGDALGRPTAPVTLQVYSDLECLTERGWVLGLLPAIVGRFVRNGRVRIEFRSFKTDTLSSTTFIHEQAAALAAGAQSRAWNFVETFYYEQGKEYTPYATERYIDGIGAQVPGLRSAQWKRRRQAAVLNEQVVDDDKTVRELHIHDTPAFMVGRTGGPMEKLTGRHIVLQFPSFSRMRYPVSLVDAEDLQKAIKRLRS